MMETLRFTLSSLPEKEENLSLALGNFDGCHKGHQRLFVETSLHAKGVAAALFFSSPFQKGPYLSNVEDKVRYALVSRLDRLYVLENEASLFELTPEEFIQKVLLPLGTKRVVVGEDFRFGKGGLGTPKTLEDYFDVDIVPLLYQEERKVSSSSIKEFLSLGQVGKAREYLGRSYEISGKVVTGLHNGEKLGYPTANIGLSFDYLLPRPGVYAGFIYIGGIAHKAMINVGDNPTIGKLDHPIVEVHILDYDEDCYGRFVYVGFLAHIREEIKFASLEELKKQLRVDEINVREALS